MRVHQEQQVRIALLQAPASHLGALDLALQLGHLLLKQDVAGGDSPVVEGEDRDHHQQDHQHEGGQAAGPPVRPETHHGAEPGCTPVPRRRRLQADAQAEVAELPGVHGPRAGWSRRRADSPAREPEKGAGPQAAGPSPPPPSNPATARSAGAELDPAPAGRNQENPATRTPGPTLQG